MPFTIADRPGWNFTLESSMHPRQLHKLSYLATPEQVPGDVQARIHQALPCLDLHLLQELQLTCGQALHTRVEHVKKRVGMIGAILSHDLFGTREKLCPAQFQSTF
jgi:hypothetical protein